MHTSAAATKEFDVQASANSGGGGRGIDGNPAKSLRPSLVVPRCNPTMLSFAFRARVSADR